MGHWRIAVSDKHEGFPQEQAIKIFEPFQRLHIRTVSGSGIGLATCKRVIERLGGKIWAESIPGSGATFYFTMPTATPQTNLRGASAGDTGSQSRSNSATLDFAICSVGHPPRL